MAQPEALSVDDALDRLVNQFSDPMALFRELVQNSLDAGSQEVEIRFGWERGTMVVHVDDWGCGMSREIIETQLTRLFSSSKEGDRTMIGKFGIGFVSVFAIEPKAVCVDTSRAGEHWRVLFDDRRRFSLIRREQPVEGTKIQIFKDISRGEFERFKARAREVVGYWCKHVRGEVRFEGELINEPFELDLACKIRHERDDETILVGHPHDGQGFAGFYNRGLTLVERTSDAPIPGLVFKASSPRLQHTLTRDDVIREKSYESLLRLVDELARGPLARAAFGLLDQRVRSVDPSGATPEAITELEYGWRAVHWHLSSSRYEVSAGPRGLFRSPSGRVIESRELVGVVNAAVVVARRRSATSDRLEHEGAKVVWLPEGCVAGEQLLAFVTRERRPIAHWCTAVEARDVDEARRWQPLLDAVARLLERAEAKLSGVRMGHLDAADPVIAERVAITQKRWGEATPIHECGELGTGLFSSERLLVLAADHPTIRAATALAQHEPELAAYFAVKAFFLVSGGPPGAKGGTKLDAKTDEVLALLTHELRLGRMAEHAGGAA